MTTTPRLVSRRYGATGHGYTLDGQKVPSVTTILNALPKQLTQWASDQAANYAVEHWDELTQQTMTKRLDLIRYAHKDSFKKAGVRGTEIHAYGEQLVAGQPVDVADEHRGPVEAYARFLDKWGIEPIATEAAIANTTNRYAGRGDLWATITRLDGIPAYIDLKTGTGVYETAALQATAYNHADLWQPDGPDSETTYTPVDRLFVAHILPDDVRLLPITTGPEHFRQFLYVQQTAAWLDLHGFRGDVPLIGEALRP